MVPEGVELCDLHRFELIEPCELGYLVFTGVGIELEVSDIGDVTDVPDFEAEMGEVSEEDVEGDGRSCMSEVRIAIDGGATDIKSDVGRV
jgi:hypothetical protein